LASYRDLCEEIIELDATVLSAAVATFNGEIVAARSRGGPFGVQMTPQESDLLFIMQSLMRMSMRRTLEPTLGKTIYSFTEYQNIKRATLPLYDQSTHQADAVLVVSLDKDSANAHLLIEEKIKPVLKRIHKLLE
jgi:hypothetical protein